MIIRDIIKNNEYILSEVDDCLEFQRLTTDIGDTTGRDVLIIPNSAKLPKNINSSPPLAVICDANARLPDSFPTIRVKNPRVALANAYYRYENLSLDGIKLIGITGTNGKGGTADFIKMILCQSGYKVGLIGTGKIEIDNKIISDKYYSMTTPDPPLLFHSLALMKKEGCQVIIMEVSSHALALDKLGPLIFDYAVFTNLSKEHMDFHRDMESYFKAKLKLFSMCRCGVFNIDDEYGRRAFSQCSARRISNGILWRGDAWASNIENNGLSGIGYIYHQGHFSFRMSLNTAGIYNAYNSMLAATVCIDMGCKPCEVKRILGEVEALPGRFEIINDKVSVIIDYAHTDVAFRSIMKELVAIKGTKNLTVVFGCGGERDKEKRPKMAKIAERYASKVIVTSDNPRGEDPKSIIADIIRGFEGGKYQVIENRKEAIRAAILGADDDELIAIIGKGNEGYIIDQSGYNDYSERQVISSALAERKAIRK